MNNISQNPRDDTAAMTPMNGQEQAVRFARSQSQLQAFHDPSAARVNAPSAAHADGQSVVFQRSQSESQAIVEAEKTEEVGVRGPIWRLKNAFLNPKNIVSTCMSMGFIKAWTDKTFGAWGARAPTDRLTEAMGVNKMLARVPHMDKFTALAYGKDFDRSKVASEASHKPTSFFEKTYAAGVTASLIQNMAFFMTARGGELPEGDTMFQRAVNSIKNPDKHSVHFSNATISGFIMLIAASRIGMGLQGMKNPEDRKKSAALLVAGVSGLISAPLVFTGLFRMKNDPNAQKETPQTAEERQAQLESEAEKMLSHKSGGGQGAEKEEKTSVVKGLASSLKPSHLRDMWQYALKHDKIGMAGRALALVVEMGFIASGRMELQKNPTSESAYKTVKGGMMGMLLTGMQMHFVYDRLLNNSRKEQAAPAR